MTLRIEVLESEDLLLEQNQIVSDVVDEIESLKEELEVQFIQSKVLMSKGLPRNGIQQVMNIGFIQLVGLVISLGLVS